MVTVDVLVHNERGELEFYDGDKDYTGPFVFMFFCDNGTVTFELKNPKSLALKIESAINEYDQKDYFEIITETADMKFLIGDNNYYIHMQGSKNNTILLELKREELIGLIKILKEY